jgi:anaerobic dimethyl sulfoxide reductase subunit C (anchor subunit)
MNLREWALPLYTVLMQLATGMLLVFWVIRHQLLKQLSSLEVDKILRKPMLMVFLTPIVAMVGSHFHLSDPWISFLAILNVLHSWLSREVLLSVLFFITVTLLFYFTWFFMGEKQRLKTILGWVGVALGITGIFSMSMCYLIPAQPAWDHPFTMALFYCSALILGTISAFTILFMDAIFSGENEPELTNVRYNILRWASRRLMVVILVVMVLIVAMNSIRVMNYQTEAPNDQLTQTTLALLLVLYQPLFIMRFITLIGGAGLFALVNHWLVKKRKSLKELVIPVYLSCLMLLMAEILGRFLFYAAHIRVGL